MTYYPKSRQVIQVPLDKLLFAIACAYFGLTVTWLFNHQKPQTISMAQAQTPLPTQPKTLAVSEQTAVIGTLPCKGSACDDRPSAVSQSVPQLNQVVKAIEQQNSTQTVATQTPPLPVVSSAVKVPLPPPPPITQSSATPVERIYIPVYPQNPSLTTPQPPKPPKMTAARVMIPPPPPTKTPTATAMPAPPVPLQTTGGKLVGVLELGERSSALFDTNGLTKRVAIGENINGWLVMKVENQQVFLNRGSITKVIDVGQTL